MKLQNSLLVIRQLDKKMEGLQPLQGFSMPQDGWIRTIRKTLQMSLRQLGKRMSMTPQSVLEVETREKEGSITLKSLREAGEALNMTLVYGFLPKDGSLEKMIEWHARELALKIIYRTSTTMKLEDQENSSVRLNQAVEEMMEELKREPKKLWD
ncbi:mobile mystery protein A [Chitinophaga sp. XS-30]|uniref:mobile mystery protein A n=1 Tax=Chitinophaga sp. XS-30 TaxID=2604421 RepID=UPI0011DCEDEA|nr:mobile mystery protein A [Chitinophaga sp. XS-30]QEH43530.1 mobile mystery protein A [Chitinophaga sp. XS-30]